MLRVFLACRLTVASFPNQHHLSRLESEIGSVSPSLRFSLKQWSRPSLSVKLACLTASNAARSSMGTSNDTDEQVEDAAAVFIASLKQQGSPLPALVVVDLDYTLWPFYCECRWPSDTPFLYREALPVLKALARHDIPVAVASRTPTPDIARAFLSKLRLSDFFVAAEIFPSATHKTAHIAAIAKATGVAPRDMLFFDDEQRNIRGVGGMGATAVLVEDGVCLAALREGLARHAERGGVDAIAKGRKDGPR